MIGAIAGAHVARNPAITIQHAKRISRVGLVIAAIVAALIVAALSYRTGGASERSAVGIGCMDC